MASERSSLGKAVAYGAASAALYYLLYLYAGQTVEWAALTRGGEKFYFIAPLLIAFVFSYVHGAFTGYFWDAVGLKAKGQKK